MSVASSGAASSPAHSASSLGSSSSTCSSAATDSSISSAVGGSSALGASRFAPRSKKRRNGMSGKRARGEEESSPAGALQKSNDLDAHRANEGELARVRPGAEEQRANGAHDQLDVARLEEFDRGEPALDVRKGELEVLGGGQRRELLWRRDPARGVAGREVQLVQPDQRCLREIERRMFRRRNEDSRVHPIENVIRQTAVLATEDHRDGSVHGGLEQFAGGFARINEAPLRAATPRGEA